MQKKLPLALSGVEPLCSDIRRFHSFDSSIKVWLMRTSVHAADDIAAINGIAHLP